MDLTPSKLKVAQLKEELKNRGLSPIGLKKELVERLEAALENPEKSSSKVEEPETEASKVEETNEEVEQTDNTPSRRSKRSSGKVEADLSSSPSKEAKKRKTAGRSKLSETADEEMHEADELAADNQKSEPETKSPPAKSPKRNKSPSPERKPQQEIKATETKAVETPKKQIPIKALSPKKKSEDINKSPKWPELSNEHEVIPSVTSVSEHKPLPLKNEMSKETKQLNEANDEEKPQRRNVSPVRAPAKNENSNARSLSPSKESHKVKKAPESKDPPTSTLHIKNFVRPLSVQGLKELLGKYGELKYFWMDAIKSHCFVQYEDLSNASIARDELYGLNWPPEIGRALIVDYISQEEAEIRSSNQLEKLKGNPEHEDSKHSAKKSNLRLNHEAYAIDLSLDDIFLKTTAQPQLYYKYAEIQK